MYIRIRIVFLLVALLGGYVQAQADSNPLWFGVVRADKTIVPFALFDGSSWSNPWPKGEMIDPRVAPDTTLTLDRIPKAWHAPLPEVPREWYVRSVKGEFNAVTITKPVTVYSWCETYWGLLIGNAEIPVNTHRGVLKEGFATSSKVQTNPGVPVSKDSAEWIRLLAFIRPAFEKSEADKHHPFTPTDRERAQLVKEGWVIVTPQDLPPTDRARAELVLIRLDSVKTGPDGCKVFHFEVERDYAKTKQMPARSLFPRSCMEGWIAADSKGALSLITCTLGFENDAGGAIIRITPLGTVTLGGKTLWVVKKRYYEGEHYSVIEITPSGIRELIDTYGGGC